MSNVIKSWMSPKQFLVANKIKVTAGMVLDPVELGMPDEPRFGPLPVLTVLVAKDDGSIFLLGEIECACGEKREIHPGDWFQIRGCRTCTKKAQRSAKAVHKTDEEKEAAKLEREVKYASEAAIRAEKSMAAHVAAAEKRAADARAKLELLRAVAAEKGVGISGKAVIDPS